MKIGVGRAAGMAVLCKLPGNNFLRSFHSWLFNGMLLLLLMIVPAATGLSQASSDAEKKILYSQGTEYFHQATEIHESDMEAAIELYGNALLRFERLVAEGKVNNGKLYYNIGNIHFLLDDIGRAILNYRRAEQFIPNDPNLMKNLAYARNMRPDKFVMQERRTIFKTLFFFHYDFAIQTRLIIFSISYLCFWTLAGIRVFTNRPFTSWGLGFALLFILLFGASLYWAGSRTMGPAGVILAREIVGRQGDADSYQPSFAAPLHAGTEFTLLENRDDWWLIELPDGRSSWIPARSGELVRK